GRCARSAGRGGRGWLGPGAGPTPGAGGLCARSFARAAAGSWSWGTGRLDGVGGVAMCWARLFVGGCLGAALLAGAVVARAGAAPGSEGDPAGMKWIPGGEFVMG